MSSVPTITRRMEFDAGHRVLGHEGKCANLHGHRYVAELTVRPREGLDPLSRVIDFSVVKELVGGWIDNHWDHNILLNADDPLALMLKHGKIALEEPLVTMNDLFGRKLPYIMIGNPTAESMAQNLHFVASSLLGHHPIEVVNVRLYETPNCWADFSG